MNVPLSPDEDFNIWVLLYQARDAVFRAREKELSQYGITAMEAGALFVIQATSGKTTPAEISRWMFRQHHTVTALLSRMAKKGLITKARDSAKKNMWRVSLTKKGEKAYRQSIKRESIHTAMSALSENDRQQLGSYSRKVRDQALKNLVREPTLPFP